MDGGRVVTGKAVTPSHARQSAGFDGTDRWPRLPAGWPLAALLVGFPLWWVVGLAQFALVLAAIPMTWHLIRLGRAVRVPKGFTIWALFLAWVAVSVVAMNEYPPGTVAPSGAGRFLAFGVRFLNYVAVTVVLLYVGNLDDRTLPRSRIIRWLAALAVWLVALGVLAVLFPHARFPAVTSLVLPQGIDRLLNPDGGMLALAQVMGVLGYETPRPAAPFAFTNAWGNVLALLLPWLVVGGWVAARRMRVKLAVAATVLVACVPLIFSLNRGVWIGLGIAIAYVAARMALRGQLLGIALLSTTAAVVLALVAVTPLGGLVSSRVENGHSDGVRASLAREAVNAATSSPLLGYGSTRAMMGSDASIAIGQTDSCRQCGNRNIGSTGQLWLLLVSQGFPGAALYFAFLLQCLWTYRKDHSAIGIAGSCTVLLLVYFALFYTALTMPLAIAFVAIGLLWRNHAARRTPEAQAPEAGARQRALA